jgi:hypothetical protein
MEAKLQMSCCISRGSFGKEGKEDEADAPAAVGVLEPAAAAYGPLVLRV